MRKLIQLILILVLLPIGPTAADTLYTYTLDTTWRIEPHWGDSGVLADTFATVGYAHLPVAVIEYDTVVTGGYWLLEWADSTVIGGGSNRPNDYEVDSTLIYIIPHTFVKLTTQPQHEFVSPDTTITKRVRWLK